MYSRDAVMQQSLQYFEGDDLAASTFLKYALKDRTDSYHEATPDDMHKNRLAPEFARMEAKFGGPRALTEQQIYDKIAHFKYIVPQGSPMMGIGNNFANVSLSNCVVVASPEDSISSIMDRGKEMANLFKRRCGVGIDVSTLRPDGTFVSNAAGTTSGAWSFADFYSYVCRMIGQKGRRGALMISMDVRHPDILKFITMKNDLTKVTGANVSIRITDDFMEAVQNDEDFLLRWPCDSDEPKVSTVVKAQDVWHTIVESATKTAEPGLLMWDNITRMLPAHNYPMFSTVCTNPCQPADATLLTPNGIRTMGEIKIGDVIWSGKQWTKVLNKWSTGTKEVYEYHTRAGVFLGTQNHRVLSNGIKIEVQNAESIDLCTGETDGIEWDEKHFTYQSDNASIHILDGLVLGDGGVHRASNNLVGLYIGKHDQDYFDSIEIKSLIGKHRPAIKESFYEVKSTITAQELDYTYNRYIPDRYFRANSDVQMCFLRGLYSANGSIVDKRITLKTSSKKLLLQVQQMLSSLGIRSYYTINKPKYVKFANGTYECKESYDLNISTDRNIFAKNIGFIQKYKTEKLDKILDTKTGRTKNTYNITDVIYRSTEEVFDITVEAEEHTYWTGGLLVSNCGEVPLSPYDSCRLISQCLKNFVVNPFTSDAHFNYDLFIESTQMAQRMSDDLIELEIEKLDNILSIADTDDEIALFTNLKNAAVNGRRTGLGTHGLADALAGLCLRYDSDEALHEIDKIYESMKLASYGESVELAKERGPFPVWDWEIEKDNAFILSLPEDLRNSISIYGRRNISNLTGAPTGSISIESRCSSGCEPIFRLSYARRKKKNHDEAPEETDFIDAMGDRWRIFDVYHPAYQEFLDNHYAGDSFPDFFVTSDEINWERRVEIQATMQKHIDHSISSTINLPRNTPSSVVATLYEKAWKLGLKGVTVYVDGCRDGVLLSKEETVNDSFNYKTAHVRPEILECDIHTVSIKGDKWTIIVGLIDDKPYEVFGGLSNAIYLPNKTKAGQLIKRAYKTKTSEYDLDLGDGFIIKDVANVFNNDLYPVHTRMISLSLRHGAQPSFVAEQLLKDNDSDLTSFSKGLARVLKKYIENGTRVTSDKLCLDCKSEGLVYQDGCPICIHCGWTKCN